jgi:hypothetical protein
MKGNGLAKLLYSMPILLSTSLMEQKIFASDNVSLSLIRFAPVSQSGMQTMFESLSDWTLILIGSCSAIGVTGDGAALSLVLRMPILGRFM